MRFEYGKAYERHPIAPGQCAAFDCGSLLSVADLTEGVPEYMSGADLLFIDPPWNKGNLRSFYTKAGIETDPGYEDFLSALFRAVGEIAPRACYLEVGKQYLARFITEMHALFPRVTFYNATYYHRPENLCYIVRGSIKGRAPRLDGLDEEDAIAWVCRHEEYAAIGDLCMGRGLVATGAKRAGRVFLGTELNPRRLSVAIERVVALGGSYRILEGGKE